LLARLVTEFRYRVIHILEFINVIAKLLNTEVLIPIRKLLKVLGNSTTPHAWEYQPETAISHVSRSYQELKASC
jgi:hypothetical protein